MTPPRRLTISGSFRILATTVFLWMASLHASLLLLGRETVVREVMHPLLDVVVGLVMLVTAQLGQLAWTQHRGTPWERCGYVFAQLLLWLGMPVHLSTALTQSTDYMLAWPLWCSAVAVPLYAALATVVGRLRFDAGAGRATA